MFHNNLIDGPTVQPLYVKSKKQTFCECDGPGKRRFVSFDLGGHVHKDNNQQYKLHTA
jgi:hypothetical protein